MNSSVMLFSLVYILGVLISSIAQLFLKKSATSNHTSIIKEYLNKRVILSYSVFVLATFCTLFAYKGIPLSFGPILSTTEYIFVALLSAVFLKEKMSARTITGLALIIAGIVIFSY